MTSRREDDIAAKWDAGEAGCSRLIVGLKKQLSCLPAGASLEVTAKDPGAPIDLWVWCRMTGNEMVFESHPVYVIRHQPRST